MNKGILANALLICFFMIVALLMATPTKSVQSTSQKYDPWVDLNDDGWIDIYDAITLAGVFNTNGTPINKTALLLDLSGKVDSIQKTLDQSKTMRFFDPNEKVITDQTYLTVANFTWKPNNSTNNAILSISFYFEYDGLGRIRTY